MIASSIRRVCLIVLLVNLFIAFGPAAPSHAQTKAANATAAANANTAAAAWSVKVNGGIRWQQITPAGALLVATDSSLAGVDIDHGQVTWEKPELAGIAADSVRPMEDSLLMIAERPDLLTIFDPVTGAVVFDSRKLALSKVVTRRVLPQSGTLLVHGQRTEGPAVVALYDLSSGQQLWVNDSLFTQGDAPKKRGFGALMQNLTRMVGSGTELEVLQAGPDAIIVHTLMGLRSLDARSGAVRWSASLPTQRGAVARHDRRRRPASAPVPGPSAPRARE